MVGGGGFAALTWLTVMTVAEALTADPGKEADSYNCF